MISLLLFALFGIVQGILEWLPVSSEGQILFLGNLFGILDQNLLLSIAFWLHFGTMLAVLILYRHEWYQILNIWDERGKDMRVFLIITTIFTGVVGVPIKIILLEKVSGAALGFWLMLVLALALVGTGILLKLQRSSLEGERTLSDLSYKEMALIGMAQGFTIIPGVSRSGTTITALLFSRVNSDDSFRGSFFMSVPAVLGAIGLDLIDYIRGSSESIIALNPVGIIVAIALAAIFGIITMKILLKFAQETDFSNIVLVLALLVFVYIFLVLIQ